MTEAYKKRLIDLSERVKNSQGEAKTYWIEHLLGFIEALVELEKKPKT